MHTLCYISIKLQQLEAVTMAASEKNKDKVKGNEQVITAVYKLNLHCNECARSVEKPIIRTQGVQTVDIDVESGKVTVKGIFDARKMHQVIEKKTKKKAEWLSPKPKEIKEEKADKIKNKEVVVRSTVIKLSLHCENCENDLENILLKLRGVHSVKMNREDQTCTVDGTVGEEQLVEYIYKKAGKRGKITVQKNKDEEKNVEEQVVGLKSRDAAVPYFIHCTHAPQWLSDENPNACSIM